MNFTVRTSQNDTFYIVTESNGYPISSQLLSNQRYIVCGVSLIRDGIKTLVTWLVLSLARTHLDVGTLPLSVVSILFLSLHRYPRTSFPLTGIDPLFFPEGTPLLSCHCEPPTHSQVVWCPLLLSRERCTFLDVPLLGRRRFLVLSHWPWVSHSQLPIPYFDLFVCSCPTTHRIYGTFLRPRKVSRFTPRWLTKIKKK